MFHIHPKRLIRMEFYFVLFLLSLSIFRHILLEGLLTLGLALQNVLVDVVVVTTMQSVHPHFILRGGTVF